MPKKSHRYLISPIYEAISARSSQNLNADYFVLIMLDTRLMECDLFINKDTDNFNQIKEELQKTAFNTWAQIVGDNLSQVKEGAEDFCDDSICDIFTNNLYCKKVLLVPFELDGIGGGFLIWGWLTVPETFSKEYNEKASLITEQTALSLKLSLKEKVSQKQNAKLTALLELSTAIYSSLNYTDVLEKAINLATKIIGADGGTIFIIDKQTNLLKPLITVDDQHEEEISKIRLKLGEGITGMVAQTGIGIISNDTGSDPRTVHVPGTPDDETESLVSAPLTWSGEVIGVITLRSLKAKEFVQDDLDILTIFARQTADAIENAKLFESLERAYKELSNTQEQLIMTEKLRALGEMAGGVAHDFNNVLGAILGRTQLLLREVKDKKWVEKLKQVEKVTLDGAKTVQKLQNFTRVSGSGIFEQVDLNKVIDDAIKLTRPCWKDECQHQGINIDLTFEREKLVPVLGNRADLIEAISNMILNAVDALVEGGYIEIKSLMKDHGAVITISDNGVGMSDGTLSRVFFPFFTTKGQQSTGMGLAVVYGIIARHKGEIDVTSKIGKGTTFCLTFKTMEKVDSKVETLTEVKEIQKVRALVIDDDENILDVMGDILKFLGHEVTLASSGEEGVELFKEGEFEIVITDLGMPGISGWEVTRICKSLKPDIPVVMISGWGNQIDDEMVKQSQLDGIMSKPFEMSKIKSMIQNTLAQKHQKQQNIVSESKK